MQMMSNLAKMLAALMTILLMTGCGVQQYAKPASSGYPYRYADFDYKYAWKTDATDRGVVIDGVMKNVRYAFIDSVAMKVELLDKDGRFIARANDFPMMQHTGEGEVTYFTLVLRGVRPAAGDMFRFTVHYTGNEGGRHGDVDWISSFRADALTGAVTRHPASSPDEW
jgi:hypothetical protein